MVETPVESVGTVPEQAEKDAKALVLLAQNEGNVAKTAKELHVTAYQLRRLRDANLELYEAAQKRIIEGIFDKVIVMTDMYLSEIIRRGENPEELDGIKIKELGVMAGIGVDKINVMTTVRAKFGGVQKAADSFGKMTDEEIADAIDGDFTIEEPKANEGMSNTPKDGLSDRPKRVSPLRSILHSRSNTGKP